MNDQKPSTYYSFDTKKATEIIDAEIIGEMTLIPCDQCGSKLFAPLFEKKSSRNENFQIVRCRKCGLVHVNPQPDAEIIKSYYEKEYFTKRTDRGYNNYFSQDLKNQIIHVNTLNLKDLGFEKFEKKLFTRSKEKPKCLDVGCAAGYFVEHMQNRGWDSMGVELSEDAALFGITDLRLNILIADFLKTTELRPASFDLITLWASIEHMHSPSAVLKKIYELLKPGGHLILSTCRYGLIARYRGRNWRYMNVPEHLYFFSMKGLKKLAKETGFRTLKSFSYGSGFTRKDNADFFYKLAKLIADPLVKILNQGDMMILHLEKK